MQQPHLKPKLLFRQLSSVTFCLLFICHFLSGTIINYKVIPLDDNQHEIQFTFHLEDQKTIYHNDLQILVDDPYLNVTPWQCPIEPINQYDRGFKETKKVFNSCFDLRCILSKTCSKWPDAYIHLRYFESGKKYGQTKLFGVHDMLKLKTHNQTDLVINAITNNIAINESPPIKIATPSPAMTYQQKLIQAARSIYLWVAILILIILLCMLSTYYTVFKYLAYGVAACAVCISIVCSAAHHIQLFLAGLLFLFIGLYSAYFSAKKIDVTIKILTSILAIILIVTSLIFLAKTYSMLYINTHNKIF